MLKFLRVANWGGQALLSDHLTQRLHRAILGGTGCTIKSQVSRSAHKGTPLRVKQCTPPGLNIYIVNQYISEFATHRTSCLQCPASVGAQPPQILQRTSTGVANYSIVRPYLQLLKS